MLFAQLQFHGVHELLVADIRSRCQAIDLLIRLCIFMICFQAADVAAEFITGRPCCMWLQPHRLFNQAQIVHLPEITPLQDFGWRVSACSRRVVAVHQLFAFACGKCLVCTHTNPTEAFHPHRRACVADWFCDVFHHPADLPPCVVGHFVGNVQDSDVCAGLRLLGPCEM